MNESKSVNSIKLTKLEKRVLEALSQPRSKDKYEHYPDEGNDQKGLGKLVFGDDVLNCERRGGHFCSDISMCYATRSSLSRILKQLFLKGLVKRCEPIYYYGWTPRYDENSCGYYGKTKRFLRAISIEYGRYKIEEWPFRELPYRCHVWWILTEKAKHVLADLKGEGLNEKGTQTT